MLIGLIGVESTTGTAPPLVTVTVNKQSGQADPTSASPILYDVVFSEPVTGFVFTDVFFSGSTAGGTLTCSVSGGPTSYVVSVTGMTTDGNVTVVLPSTVASSIATGALSQASTSTDNIVAWVAPPTGAWYDLYNVTLTGDSNGWSGYGMRQKVDPAHYAAGVPATGTKLRVTMQAASTTGVDTLSLYIGHGATTSGAGVSFDGTQVSFTVGGSASPVLAAGATVVSDDIPYAFNKTKSIIASAGFDGATDVKALTSGVPSTLHGAWWVQTFDQTGDTVLDSTPDVADRVYLFKRIEVWS